MVPLTVRRIALVAFLVLAVGAADAHAQCGLSTGGFNFTAPAGDGEVDIRVSTNGPCATFLPEYRLTTTAFGIEPLPWATTVSFTRDPVNPDLWHWIVRVTANDTGAPRLGYANLRFVSVSPPSSTIGTWYGISQPPRLALAAFDPVSIETALHAVRADGRIDQTKLQAPLPTRTGVAADGVTLLLLRVHSTSATIFELPPGDNGTLLTLDASIGATNPNYWVLAQPIGSYVWAIYRAPARLNAPGEPTRTISIRAYGAGALETISMTLHRPPVVMVHGAWDNPSVWQTGGFASSLRQRGFHNLYFANYEQFNAQHWDPAHPPPTDPNGRNSIRVLQQAIEQSLADMRSQSIAVTQADLVAHSTGGVLARALIRQPACGLWTPIHRYGRVQCYLDRSNLNKGWIRHLITVGTPHNGTRLARYLFDNQNARLPTLGVPLKVVAAWTGRPIDQGLVEDFIPASHAYENLGSSCDRGIQVRGYGIAGDHLPATTSFIFDLILRWMTGQTIDQYLGERNDLMSGLRSQYGRATVTPSTVFGNTVHSPSYLFGASGTVFSEPDHQLIHARVADLLELDPATHGEFACFQSDLTPVTSEVMPAADPPEAPGTIRFTAPTSGAVVRQEQASNLTLTIETEGPITPANLIFIVGNTVTIPGPAVAPFSVVVPLPRDIPLGPLNIVALALDAATQGLLGASTTITVVPPGLPTALIADVSSLTFRSARHIAANLQVLATFDRGGGESVQLDVSSSALGTEYQALLGSAVVNVSADGLVTPAAAGRDQIEIRYGGLVTTVDVVVGGPPPFTDAGLAAGTFIRAVHFSELRTRIDDLRLLAGLLPFTYTDAVLTGGVIRAQHVTELRTALDQVYSAAGLSTPAYTEPSVGPGITIRRSHVEELRAAVLALE